jgi:3-hydroxybutyryl-CoA dehydrogenase
MGRGIAQVALAAGHLVTLVEPDSAQLESAANEIVTRLERKSPGAGKAAEARLARVASIDEAPARSGTVAIEAVVERLDVKREVMRSALVRFGPECILATNTSSLSVTEIAATVAAPDRVVGMHFFNPVPVMRLVEVVNGLQTDQAVVEVISGLARSWGKDVALLRSAPGFIVNRVARAFYGEALRLVEEGASTPECIDELMRSCGQFRMGPFELMDLIGVEVNYAVSRTVWTAFNYDPRFAPSLLQKELVAAGRFGRKTGHGFFRYGQDVVKPKATPVTAGSPTPRSAVMHGRDEQLEVLLRRAGATAEMSAETQAASLELPGLGYVLVTRGRTAADESRRLAAPVVVLDRCVSTQDATAIAVAGHDARLLDTTAAMLGAAGVRAYAVQDTPGLVLARILSLVANEAWETVQQGIATPEAIDTAMVLGTNYPCGPFEWTRRWGADAVLDLLDSVCGQYRDPRYRASRRLREHASSGSQDGVRSWQM